jgi:CheY-like chemotaxis protein
VNSKAFKILVVEDEVFFSDYLIKKILSINVNIEITVADSRDEAFKYIHDESCFFDFITLDLTIPIQSRGFEKSPKNGLAVLGECRVYSQGTPILVFTATSTLEMISHFLQSSHNVDIWATGYSSSSIAHLTKTQLDEFTIKVKTAFEAVEALSNVELIEAEGTDIPLEDDRLIRIFVKNQRGVKAKVQTLGGGYSDTRVYKLILNDNNDNTIHRAVAKCGSISDIQKDATNYELMINRLNPATTPRKLKHLNFGAQAMAGVFYGLATNFEFSYFDLVKSGNTTPEIRQLIANMTLPWQQAVTSEMVKIGDIRRSLISDEKVQQINETYGLDWITVFEDIIIESNIACYHGDFHGENILVDTNTPSTNLIDYGDIATGSLTIDPISLECSLFFHKAGIGTEKWPLIENIKNWEKVEEYVKGCPVPEEIIFCRQWANKVIFDKRDLAACLYSYSLRQLQLNYEETDKKVALELINIARNMIIEA